ncbi:hypothetical protein XELAEV_18021989mg [Xenopus laevis]|uniref:Uncharacterized protein n=1 Tax=Xenopus laevis TaxID=8355 RepID=A0A974D458_XENLA|nr:hypothetical protein XELAEV_18021989mg [Xenopus laevis]
MESLEAEIVRRSPHSMRSTPRARKGNPLPLEVEMSAGRREKNRPQSNSRAGKEITLRPLVQPALVIPAKKLMISRLTTMNIKECYQADALLDCTFPQ